MTREEFAKKWGHERTMNTMGLPVTIPKYDEFLADLDSLFPPAEGAEQRIRVRNILQDFYRRGEYELEQAEEDIMRLFQPQPTVEGAEEIIESIVESLGDPTYIHNHVFEIRPYTIEHKTEWWIFHKEMGSGEPLAQWLNKFATLHAQKMTQENLREELIAYDKYASRWIDNYRAETAEDCVDEYLKSKEQ